MVGRWLSHCWWIQSQNNMEVHNPSQNPSIVLTLVKTKSVQEMWFRRYSLMCLSPSCVWCVKGGEWELPYPLLINGFKIMAKICKKSRIEYAIPSYWTVNLYGTELRLFLQFLLPFQRKLWTLLFSLYILIGKGCSAIFVCFA